MASELRKLFLAQAEEIEGLAGMEKALAILAFGSFLTGRGVLVISDLTVRPGLDDQGVIDLAKKHDAEAKEAWEKLKAETEPAG